MKPDQDTAERIENLALVGSLLKHPFGEEEQDIGGGYYIAREALVKFQAGIEKLKLDEKVHQGITDLVDYLQEKLDKRERGDFH
ncbi:MAG: hypothetical protein WCJ58_08080 [bacterium]